MRGGRVEEAGALATKVQHAIAKANSVELREMNVQHGLKDLWDKVNGLTKKKIISSNVSVTAEELNNHYVAISTDQQYSCPLRKLSATSSTTTVNEYKVFQWLDHLHHRAEGLNKIPAWYLRLAAPIYSLIIAHLIN